MLAPLSWHSAAFACDTASAIGFPVCAMPLIVAFARIMKSAAGTPLSLTSATRNTILPALVK